MAPLALLAGSVVPAVPRPTYPITHLPLLLSLADCNDIADDFAAGDDGAGGVN